MKVLVGAICFAVGTACTTSAAHEVRQFFYAACYHESHGALGFSTKRHRNPADAERDCAEHRKIYPGHRCVIEPIVY